MLFAFKEVSKKYADYYVLSTVNMKGKEWEDTGHIKQKVFLQKMIITTPLLKQSDLKKAVINDLLSNWEHRLQ